MIARKNNFFHLSTNNSSYLISILPSGIAEHIYYGHILAHPELDLPSLMDKRTIPPAMSTWIEEKNDCISPTSLLGEYATEGRGDYRTPSLCVSYEDDDKRTLDLRMKSASIKDGVIYMQSSLPQANGKTDNCQSLSLRFEDTIAGIGAELIYTVFPETDTITKRVIYSNFGQADITLRAAASAVLDAPPGHYTFSTFDGTWSAERIRHEHKIESGCYINESRKSISSPDHNPGILLHNQDTGEHFCLNLIYSGSHRTSIEITEYQDLHIVWGINPATSSFTIEPGMLFETPEAVMTYAMGSESLLISRTHAFIKAHILRGLWRDRLRPIIVRTGESLSFDLSQKKIESVAKHAEAIGAEMVVLDDGWFGVRNDHSSSIGDWSVDTEKFPDGLAYISTILHAKKLLFGLWIEPEAISAQSILFQAHPDWVIGDKRRPLAKGREEYLLDITRPDVQEYILGRIKEIIQVAKVDYIKWDLSRHMSDIATQSGKIKNYGEYLHRAILALYQMQKSIITSYPHLMLENSASGGGRFDLGMLCSASQIQCTDNTDPFDRLKIMNGTAALYPLASIVNSVDPSPSRITMRETSLETRFDLSAFGCLGYGVNITRLSLREKEIITNQIKFYKQYRPILQFGTFTCQEDDKRTIWTVSNQDASMIIALYAKKEHTMGGPLKETLRIDVANPAFNYEVFPRQEFLPEAFRELDDTKIEKEYYQVSGDTLRFAGIRLWYEVQGSRYHDGMRILGDFASRIYVIKRI